MIAVGIDISKAKSTVAVIDSDGTVLASPFTMAHTQPEIEAFVSYLKGLGEPTTILVEYTCLLYTSDAADEGMAV